MLLSKSAKIGISWAFITFAGIYAFYLSKTSIERKRYEHMKIRERIKQSNIGKYESSTRKFSD